MVRRNLSRSRNRDNPPPTTYSPPPRCGRHQPPSRFGSEPHIFFAPPERETNSSMLTTMSFQITFTSSANLPESRITSPESWNSCTRITTPPSRSMRSGSTGTTVPRTSTERIPIHAFCLPQCTRIPALSRRSAASATSSTGRRYRTSTSSASVATAFTLSACSTGTSSAITT